MEASFSDGPNFNVKAFVDAEGHVKVSPMIYGRLLGEIDENPLKQNTAKKCIQERIWGFPKMVVPNNHGKILLKMGVLGVPAFKETPII